MEHPEAAPLRSPYTSPYWTCLSIACHSGITFQPCVWISFGIWKQKWENVELPSAIKEKTSATLTSCWCHLSKKHIQRFVNVLQFHITTHKKKRKMSSPTGTFSNDVQNRQKYLFEMKYRLVCWVMWIIWAFSGFQSMRGMPKSSKIRPF